jgi:hypothetical protein
MLVPSKTAKGPPKAGRVDERMAPPGAPTSGFSTWPNAFGPPDEKLVTTPLRPTSCCTGSRPTRIGARPPRAPR